jgi:hypothetical protein
VVCAIGSLRKTSILSDGPLTRRAEEKLAHGFCENATWGKFDRRIIAFNTYSTDS